MTKYLLKMIAAPQAMLRVDCSWGVSEQNTRVLRPHPNQDSSVNLILNSGLGLFGVSDGAGATLRAELAAQLATRLLIQMTELCVPHEIGQSFLDFLNDTFQTINRGIIEQGFQLNKLSLPDFNHPEQWVDILNKLNFGQKIPVATLVAGVVWEGMLYGVSVGDSRAYLIREGKARLLSKDQSYVQQLIDNGNIDLYRAAVHESRHLLGASLGMWPLDMEPFQAPLQPGDLLVFVTDGITDLFAEINNDHYGEEALTAWYQQTGKFVQAQGGDLAQSLVTAAGLMGLVFNKVMDDRTAVVASIR